MREVCVWEKENARETDVKKDEERKEKKSGKWNRYEGGGTMLEKKLRQTTFTGRNKEMVSRFHFYYVFLVPQDKKNY